MRRFLLLVLIVVMPAISYGQAGEKSKNQIEKVDSEITIDGNIEEPAWQQADTIRITHERFPETNAEPPVKTLSLFTYDQNNLYVSFKASDPQPQEIRAHLMDRDSREQLMRDDHVGFTIDPFNNEQWGLQFRINPLGVQADAIYSNQRNTTDYSWDAIWESEGKITDDGYEVEVRIPISSINVPSDSLQDWRFSAFRNYPRSVQYRFRSHPVDLDEQSLMAQFNQISGFESLSSGLNLQISPVLTAKRTDNASGSNNSGLDRGAVNIDPGGNIQWGIKPNLNLSATINPDFSQIEADALQFRENRRFALSFPEKRPFFLESSEIFETPLNAVFTRSVIQPNAGLKMTGKMPSQSFGAFVTQDQSSRMLFPANEASQDSIVSGRTYSEIFRYRNQFTDNAALGVIAEGRQSASSNYQNYVGGVDGYWRFWNSNSLRFQYLHSSTNYSSRTSQNFDQPTDNFDGGALQLNYNYQSREWLGRAEYTSISSGFRNDNGFFPRADFQTLSASARRVFRGSSEQWYSSIQLGPDYEITTNQAGTVTDRSISFAAGYRGPLQSEVSVSYERTKQRFRQQVFSGLDGGVLFFRVQPSDFLSKFRVYTFLGESVDYTNSRKANELIIHPGLNLNISRHLNLEIDPNYKRLSYDGNTTFTTYLLGTKLIYHFNKKMFLRSNLQYRYVDRNLSEFNNPGPLDASTESLFYQLLFSYKVNPQSKLFLGYSSGYGGFNENPLTIQSRTGYLKVGYSWVL